MKKEVSFYSEGLLLAADLYLPHDYSPEKAYPSVVLCHGFAGIKQILLPAYAEKFTKEGMISLVFDYRGFGKSEGRRGFLIPKNQIIDIRNAITYLQTIPGVAAGKSGLWGTSFGGANAIYVAAEDKRVKCLAVQGTFGNGERIVTQGLAQEEIEKLQATLLKAWQREVEKNKALMMSPVQILTDEESKDFYEQTIKENPEFQTKLPLTTIMRNLEHKPEDVISRIDCPVLIIGAELDQVCPFAESISLYERAAQPKELFQLSNTKHYEIYHGDAFEKSGNKAVEWFRKYLF